MILVINSEFTGEEEGKFLDRDIDIFNMTVLCLGSEITRHIETTLKIPSKL